MKWNIENLKKEKEDKLVRYTALKKAWEQVSFPTKKDGKPFKNMGKNFDGAKYYITPYTLTDCGYVLTVNTHIDFPNRLVKAEDTILCHDTLKYMHRPVNPDNIRRQGSYVADQYLYDLDEIKNILIPERIAYFNKQIKALDTELAEFDETVKEAKKVVSDLKKNGDLFVEIVAKML